MKSISRALLIVTLLPLTALPVYASGFGHQQTLSINGQSLHIMDTSARILGDENGTAPLLLEDITDGFGRQKIAGYKIVMMSRSYSLTHHTRPPREGQQNWSNNRYIHRGTKVLVGIPVINGKMDINHAQLLNMAVISDQDASHSFQEEDKIRPRGKQLMRPSTQIQQVKFQLQALQLPNMKSGERSGGGVKLNVSALLDNNQVQTTMDTTFTEFSIAKLGTRGFATDKRFIQP